MTEQQQTDTAGGGLLHALWQDVPVALGEGADEFAMALVDRALNALFSDRARCPVQDEAEERVARMMRDTLSSVRETPDGAETARKAEALARRLTAQMLDAIFDGTLRDDIRRHAVAAVGDVLRRDMSGAQDEGEEALGALLHGLLRVLGHHSEQILQLVVKLTIDGMQAAAESEVDDKTSALESTTRSEVQERAEEVRREFRAKTEELRDRLQDTVETIRERVEGRGASTGGARRGRPGRPPEPPRLGRPPSGRPAGGLSHRAPPTGPRRRRR